MLTEDTMRKLHEMRLTVMARTLRERLQDPTYNDMPFEDRVSLLVDREWCIRKNNQLARLKKAAHFADPSACVESIEARHKVASTIFCSQFSVHGWQDKIGNPILSDAICDRIVHDSYSVLVEGKEPMRKRKGIPEDT